MRIIINVVGAAVIVLIAATIWATEKSLERTACYKRAAQVSDCPQPGTVERVIRWVSE